MRYLTPDFLALCELCRVHVPTPKPRYTHNFYRETPIISWAKARFLVGQNDLYHIGQNAATTLATGCHPEVVVRIFGTSQET